MTSDTQLDPATLDGLGGDVWDHIRREYLAGVTATSIRRRYGISHSPFRLMPGSGADPQDLNGAPRSSRGDRATEGHGVARPPVSILPAQPGL